MLLERARETSSERRLSFSEKANVEEEEVEEEEAIEKKQGDEV